MNKTLDFGGTENYFNLLHFAGFHARKYGDFEKHLEDEYGINLIIGYKFRATDETKLTLFILKYSEFISKIE
jgi:hypothetical protein